MLWAQSLRKTHSYLTMAPKDHRHSLTGENNFFQKDIPTLSQKNTSHGKPCTSQWTALIPQNKCVLFKAELVKFQISATEFLCVFAARLKSCYTPDFQLALLSNACFPILFPALCKLFLILTWRSITCTHLEGIHSSPWRDQELCSQGLQVQMWLRWD